jgi:hypothetical protein
MVAFLETRSRLFGVDFSADAKKAGTKIWMAEGLVVDGKLRVEKCVRGDQLVGSSASRDACLLVLCEYIASRPDGVFGLDFPFGLPSAVARRVFDADRWEDFLRLFLACFRRPSASADLFRCDCCAVAGGREPKRRTDREQHAPFCPHNIRLFRQTFHGIRDVIGPLVTNGSACVLPMQKPLPDRAWLLEICPSSTIRSLGINPEGYKGTEVSTQ